MSLGEAQSYEQELIAYYQSNNRKYGYNVDNGGSLNRFTNETKRKMSEIKRGEKSVHYGKFGKDSIRSKKIDQYDMNFIFIKTWGSTMDIERELGILHTAISNVCLGRSNSAGGFYWAHCGNTPLFKKNKRLTSVVKICPNSNEIIESYLSVSDAARSLSSIKNVKSAITNILNVCDGKRGYCGGFKWVYAESIKKT